MAGTSILPFFQKCTQSTIPIFKVLMGVSCVFMVMTLGVYLGVAELRDQMYGRCLISLVSAMLTAYIGHMIESEDLSDGACYAKGKYLLSILSCSLTLRFFFPKKKKVNINKRLV